MMASPISRTWLSSVWSESCHLRWSVSELWTWTACSRSAAAPDFLRRLRPVAVLQVIAEEIFVVGVVPGVVLGLGLGTSCSFSVAGWASAACRILGGDLLEQGVFHHFLRQEIGQLERRHRQQLDRLLQRGRQDELLRQLGLRAAAKSPMAKTS